MTHPFVGAGVALITPFDKDKCIDFNALGDLIEAQVSAGTDYLVALGTTAETPTLSDEEKKEIVRFIIEKNNGRLKIMVGMGGNNTRALVQTIENTDFKGIDGILSVTPYYNKPNAEGLFQHFKAVTNACPVPVVLYNVPGRTGINMDADTTLRIAHASEKIIAVKEASGDLAQFTKIAKLAPDYFKVISGDDGLALPAITIGAIGVISVIANALPSKLAQLVHASLDGNIAQAGALHLQMAEMIKLIFKEGSPAGVKALMNVMGNDKNYLRLPLVPVTPATYQLIASEWEKIKS